MDSGTHLLFGLGLGGLALVDPVIASHPYGAVAALIGTVAGSQAPDLDGLLRFKSNADYIRNHRGLSHSLPAVVGWAAAISLLLAALFRGLPWWHLALWVLLAVVVHVASDLFNAYGTQALRPFSKKWIAWNIIHIFDPFIFSSHLVALLLWMTGTADPRAIFPVLYGLIVLYYAWRWAVRRRTAAKVPKTDSGHRPGDDYTLLPTVSLHRWNVVRLSKDCSYTIGYWENGKLTWVDRTSCDQHPAIDASRNIADVQAFLNVTPFPCGQVHERPWGFEVRWIDIRYRYRRQYPFVAVALLDSSLQPLQSYVGWLSDERLEKRLRMNTY